MLTVSDATNAVHVVFHHHPNQSEIGILAQNVVFIGSMRVAR
jgi:hypothetical protein